MVRAKRSTLLPIGPRWSRPPRENPNDLAISTRVNG